ncbi:hypothetical protein CAPTEDRAFT_208419 [Capitella teleta]|uniref:GH3 domain-containing protein n=1 Tax=Capitella teleta TaxID=283909 RepID=R7VF30_CAPTE|nr:hypothetical protein CAPTEDRAFT_208419 [Capitella teleta]|eukprot:ELU14275.1 hypothetical protein CAPTEDRAFT_208419 [Capitella teleta]
MKSLMTQYVQFRLLPFYTRAVHAKFIRRCHDIGKAQEEFLLKALEANKNTEYGLHCNFASIRNRTQFVQQHPLTQYSHYEEYIQRVCNGEKNVLCAKKLAFVAISSGTTAKPKSIPVYEGFVIEFLKTLGFFLNHIINKVNTLQRIASIRFTVKDTLLANGVKMGTFSSHVSPLPPYAITPQKAGKIPNESSQSYVTALFALSEKDLQYIDGMFSSSVFTLYKTIELNGERLVADLASGSLSKGLDVGDEVRKVVDRHLKPNPIRAAEVWGELNQGNDRLALRLWPELKLVTMTTTGEFEAHARLLAKSFLKDVCLQTLVYGSTEGSIGIVPFPQKGATFEQKSYAFNLFIFLEFIAEENIAEDNPPTLFVDQLELGKSYEIVLSNTNGFYRSGHLLSVRAEKTSSAAFTEALKYSEQDWKNKHLVNYTATESTHIILIDSRVINESIRILQMINLLADFQSRADGMNYFLFIEVTYLDQNNTCVLQQKEKELIDKHLQKSSPIYGYCRSSGSIKPMSVIQVKAGTFARLKSIMTKDANNQQYKTPRALRNPELLTFLLENA